MLYICNLGREVICHAVIECSHANSIWAKSEFKDVVDNFPFEPPGKVLKWVFEKVGLEKIGKFICITWAIWTWRNQKVLAGEEMNIQILVNGFLKLLEEYQTLCMVKSHLSFDKWYPVPRGGLKSIRMRHSLGTSELDLAGLLETIMGLLLE